MEHVSLLGDNGKVWGDEYYGVCPDCHKNDGFINIGRGHWFYCKQHKKMWRVGSNIWSCWKNQTEGEQRQIFNDLGMDKFEEIPIPPGPADEVGDSATTDSIDF